jgi:hypothetical protein
MSGYGAGPVLTVARTNNEHSRSPIELRQVRVVHGCVVLIHTSFAVPNLKSNVASGRAEDPMLFHKTFAHRANVLWKRSKRTMLPQAKTIFVEVHI